MKKIISLLLVLVMVLSLAACASAKPGEDDETDRSTETSEITEPSTEESTEPAANDVTVMTHAEFVAAEMETQVVIETYVQTVESWWDGACHIYAQSEDGGYYIYSYACTEDEAAALVPGTKIRVTGYKTEWSGEVEIVDASIEILEGSYIVTEPVDATALLGTEDLADLMNSLVSFKGLTVVASNDEGAAFLYKWDGSGSQGDDLYFKVTNGTEEFTFTVNVYMVGTGADSEVYKAVEALQVGDVIDVAGFLYWYEGPQPHLTSVTPVASETPASDFTASSAYTTICNIIDQNMGDMSPEYEYDAESKVLYIYLLAPEGTAAALATNPTALASSWETLKTSFADLSSSVQVMISTNGYPDIHCCIMLRNDANPDNVLLGILDGEVVFDAMSE